MPKRMKHMIHKFTNTSYVTERAIKDGLYFAIVDVNPPLEE